MKAELKLEKKGEIETELQSLEEAINTIGNSGLKLMCMGITIEIEMKDAASGN